MYYALYEHYVIYVHVNHVNHRYMLKPSTRLRQNGPTINPTDVLCIMYYMFTYLALYVFYVIYVYVIYH